jgi:hypothetical protein
MKTTLESIFTSVYIDLNINEVRINKVLGSNLNSLGHDKRQKLARLANLLEVARNSLLDITSDLTEPEKKHLM